MSEKPIDEAAYRNGQDEYARGGSLRSIVNRMNAADTVEGQHAGLSALIGFLDGLVSSVRRIDSQMMMPPSTSR